MEYYLALKINELSGNKKWGEEPCSHIASWNDLQGLDNACFVLYDILPKTNLLTGKRAGAAKVAGLGTVRGAKRIFRAGKHTQLWVAMTCLFHRAQTESRVNTMQVHLGIWVIWRYQWRVISLKEFTCEHLPIASAVRCWLWGRLCMCVGRGCSAFHFFSDPKCTKKKRLVSINHLLRAGWTCTYNNNMQFYGNVLWWGRKKLIWNQIKGESSSLSVSDPGEFSFS